jgi:hypothetical protein
VSVEIAADAGAGISVVTVGRHEAVWRGFRQFFDPRSVGISLNGNDPETVGVS